MGLEQPSLKLSQTGIGTSFQLRLDRTVQRCQFGKSMTALRPRGRLSRLPPPA